MARIVYACARSPQQADLLERRLRTLCQGRALVPDNIEPNPAVVRRLGSVVYGIVNPAQSVLEHGGSVLAGQLLDGEGAWWKPLRARPEGSCAVFRHDADRIEVASDAVASRTVWYYQDEERFVAATSQRAIVMLLGDFSFDERVLPWLLSTGTLGPVHAWDRRIRRLPPDASLTLDRRSWALRATAKPRFFAASPRSDDEHAAALRDALLDTFAALRVDPSRWVLPLSGGYDSRSILSLLDAAGHDARALRAVTWGLAASPQEEGSDAHVAREVARHYGLAHEFYPTDGQAPADVVLDRFVVAGEGRIDHLSGYMDGFAVWKALFERGVAGILRGDEGFGWVPVSSPEAVRLQVGIGLCADYADLREWQRDTAIAQELPDNLGRGPDETLAGWRDRLYHEYRIPTWLAALADLKFAYVEQASPLLSRRLIEEVRQLPDHLRTDKRLFRHVVSRLGPPLRYARRGATAPVSRLLRQPEMVAHLRDELSGADARHWLGARFHARVVQGLALDTSRDLRATPSLRARLGRIVPAPVKNILRRSVAAPRLDANVLGFRVYLASRMRRRLTADAAAVAQP